MEPSLPEKGGGALPEEDDSTPSLSAPQQLGDDSSSNVVGGTDDGGETTNHQSASSRGTLISDVNASCSSRLSPGPLDRLISDNATSSSRESRGLVAMEQQEDDPVVQSSDPEPVASMDDHDDDDKKPVAEVTEESTSEEKKKKKRKVVQYPLNEVMPNGEVKDRWDIMFDRLVEYKKKHGNTLVPNRYKEDRSLGSWVSTQRRQYKILVEASAQSTPMTPERAARLNEIGFVWATKDPRQIPWGTRIKQLIEFKRLHGHCLVPVGYPPNPKLATWVSTQRQEKKALDEGRPSRLDAQKVKLLEDLGFAWEARREGYRKRKASPLDRTTAAGSRQTEKSDVPMKQQFRTDFVPPTASAASGDAIERASLPSPSESSSGVYGVARLPSHLQELSSAARGSTNPAAQERERMMMALQIGSEQESRLLRVMEREQILQRQQQELLLASQMQSLNQHAFPPYTGYAGLFSLDQSQSRPLRMRSPAVGLPLSSPASLATLQSLNMLMQPIIPTPVQPQLRGMERIPGRQHTEHSFTRKMDCAELDLFGRMQESPLRRQLRGDSLMDRARVLELILQQNGHPSERDEGYEIAGEEYERSTKRSRQG